MGIYKYNIFFKDAKWKLPCMYWIQKQFISLINKQNQLSIKIIVPNGNTAASIFWASEREVLTTPKVFLQEANQERVDHGKKDLKWFYPFFSGVISSNITRYNIIILSLFVGTNDMLK